MVDELEMNIMDADERNETPVRVIFSDVLNGWYIVHDKSGQSAFRSSVNGFDSYALALQFCDTQDVTVI